MKREEMADLTAFAAVAEEGSFTRAAVRLGMSQSALSQVVRRLEGRLGIRLLARTTRSVAPTEAGERILQTLAPALRELEQSIGALSELKDKPSGTLRINSLEHATQTILRPVMQRFLSEYPDISVEVIDDYAFTDIVADRYDAGIRLGQQVDQDMIAVRISPDIPMAVVATPGYFQTRQKPRQLRDLLEHRCINLNVLKSETSYQWRFMENGRPVKVRVSGPLSVNTLQMARSSALDSIGLAYVPLDLVSNDIAAGLLVQVLAKRTQKLPGYHLYYPNRRHASSAFQLFVNAVRYRS